MACELFEAVRDWSRNVFTERSSIVGRCMGTSITSLCCACGGLEVAVDYTRPLLGGDRRRPSEESFV